VSREVIWYSKNGITWESNKHEYRRYRRWEVLDLKRPVSSPEQQKDLEICVLEEERIFYGVAIKGSRCLAFCLESRNMIVLNLRKRTIRTFTNNCNI
jgi:hypothetical protein